MSDELITIDLRWQDGHVYAIINGDDKALCSFPCREPITSATKTIDLMTLVGKAADLLNTPIYGIEHDRHFLFFHTDPLPEDDDAG